MTLAQAKHAVDSILDGEVLTVTLADRDSSDELGRRSAQLGAVCHSE